MSRPKTRGANNFLKALGPHLLQEQKLCELVAEYVNPDTEFRLWAKRGKHVRDVAVGRYGYTEFLSCGDSPPTPQEWKKIATLAAENGHLEVLKIMTASEVEKCNVADLFCTAVNRGQLQVLRYLYPMLEEPPLYLEESVLWNLIKKNYVEVLRWFLDIIGKNAATAAVSVSLCEIESEQASRALEILATNGQCEMFHLLRSFCCPSPSRFSFLSFTGVKLSLTAVQKKKFHFFRTCCLPHLRPEVSPKLTAEALIHSGEKDLLCAFLKKENQYEADEPAEIALEREDRIDDLYPLLVRAIRSGQKSIFTWLALDPEAHRSLPEECGGYLCGIRGILPQNREQILEKAIIVYGYDIELIRRLFEASWLFFRKGKNVAQKQMLLRLAKRAVWHQKEKVWEEILKKTQEFDPNIFCCLLKDAQKYLKRIRRVRRDFRQCVTEAARASSHNFVGNPK